MQSGVVEANESGERASRERRRSRFEGRSYTPGVSEGGGANGRRDDRPRLLAARSEHGYVDRPNLALPEEPEAVSAEEQRRQSEQGHRRDRQRRIAAYTSAASTISTALDDFVAAVGADSRVVSQVRVVRRQVAALGRELGA